MKLFIITGCCLVFYPIFIYNNMWHVAPMAHIFYIFLTGTLIYLFIKKQLDRYSLYRESTREMLTADDYLSELYQPSATLKQNELHAELSFKNKELGTLTMQLVERGRLLSKIKEELVQLKKINPSISESKELKTALRMLTEAEADSNDWEQFSVHFDETHRNFLSVLKLQHPALSTTDLKLCAYLRLNLSSKEIAQSMNITVKGVEVSRYRLRKKLNLSKEVNLFDFLLNLTEPGNTSQISAPDIEINHSQEEELANFLSFFNKSMTAKFISQGSYDFSGEGIIFKGPIAHNKG